MSGPPAYGFRRQGDRLVVEPGEAEVRKLMVEMFLRTRRIKTVARLLNEAGHRTRSGPFSDTTVRRLLRDPAAAGSIVTEETWKRCQDLLDGRERVDARPAKAPVHLFAGKVSCGCGGAMEVRAGLGAPRLVCPRCRTRVPSDTLERVVVDALAGVEFEPAEVLTAFASDRAVQAALARTLSGRSATVASVWPLLAPEERVELVDLLVAQIRVSGAEVGIELAIPSKSPAPEATQPGNTLPNPLSLEG